MPRGGKRPGAGRPKGSLEAHTLKKQVLREVILAKYAEALGPMLDAQIAHAKGVSYMRLRNPDGSFARATDEKQIDAAIAAGATWFQIFTENPHTPAFTALSDRAIDKPIEPVALTGAEGGPLLVMWKGE
jgi:polysaccharide pyruvyl transferase WcaK-like protein